MAIGPTKDAPFCRRSKWRNSNSMLNVHVLKPALAPVGAILSLPSSICYSNCPDHCHIHCSCGRLQLSLQIHIIFIKHLYCAILPWNVISSPRTDIPFWALCIKDEGHWTLEIKLPLIKSELWLGQDGHMNCFGLCLYGLCTLEDLVLMLCSHSHAFNAAGMEYPLLTFKPWVTWRSVLYSMLYSCSLSVLFF